VNNFWWQTVPNIYNALAKNDFLPLTSLYTLNNLNGWPSVVTTVYTILEKKSPNFTSTRLNGIL